MENVFDNKNLDYKERLLRLKCVQKHWINGLWSKNPKYDGGNNVETEEHSLNVDSRNRLKSGKRTIPLRLQSSAISIKFYGFFIFALLLPCLSIAKGWEPRESTTGVEVVDSSTKKSRLVFINQYLSGDEVCGGSCDPDTDYSQYFLDFKYKPLSLVGPYLSVEKTVEAFEGGAHNYGGTQYLTINLDKEKKLISNRDNNVKKVLLTDIFPEDVVLKALLSDKIIKSEVKRKKIKSLKELSDLEREFSFSNLNESFSFHHLEGNKVAVRIGLSGCCSVNERSLIQIGILLAVPKNLAENFNFSAKKKFLMTDHSATAKK